MEQDMFGLSLMICSSVMYGNNIRTFANGYLDKNTFQFILNKIHQVHKILFK